MGWANKLYATYEHCKAAVGQGIAEEMLLPVGHTTQNAQIEVSLTPQGEFYSAVVLDKSQAVTVIPVTEDSQSRSSGIAPHPLHDKLIYLAKDYPQYTHKENQEYVKAYLYLLNQWKESSSSHPVIEPIYTYLSKGKLIQDLIASGTLKQNESGFLDDSIKFQKTIAQAEVFVRFRLFEKAKLYKVPWEDVSLFQAFNEFYANQISKQALCYINGEIVNCTDKHPAKIRYSGDKAKLISSNDSSGFTYRGRFADKEEALSVGYEASQKIHNALRWLLKRQGFATSMDNEATWILTWNTQERAIPDYLKEEMIFQEEQQEQESSEIDTEVVYAEKIKNAVLGYAEPFEEREEIMVMALDAATTGRLSITYYQEMLASSFYQNLKHWYTTCSWPQYKKKEGMQQMGTPNSLDIIEVAFGVFQNAGYNVNAKVKAMQLKRLLPCIVQRQKIPSDIVHGAFIQTVNLAKNNDYHAQRALGVACALIKKDRYDRKGVNWSMDIDKNKMKHLTSIDYACGRLLAVIDEIERYALSLTNEKRPTNARRLYVQFQKHPERTIQILDKQLNPYLVRLGNRSNHLMEIRGEICNEIIQLLSEQNVSFTQIKNLNGEFLLGFEAQKIEIRNEIKNRSEKNVEKEEE